MSARVFNPMVMSDMSRMLRAYDENGPRHITSSSPDTAERNRVRRNLFGPVDHDATRRFVSSELSDQQTRDADRWGFDFQRETPRSSGPGTARYNWEKVPNTETVPEPYALRRLPCLQQATVTVDEKSDDSTTTATAKISVEAVPKESALKQSRIPDYMKGRKRTFASTATSTATKSSSAPPPPAKQARTTPS